jgi:hypothetical protein
MTSADGDGLTVRLTIPARAEYITLCRLALTGIGRVRALSDVQRGAPRLRRA